MALGKLSELSGKFGPMISQMSGMMGVEGNHQEMFSKLESMRSVIQEVNAQFQDPVTNFYKRKKQHLYAYAYQSFYHYTKQNE